MKLNVKAFAITGSLIWGLGVFMLTWWVMLFDGPTRERTCLGRIYRGYEISPKGSVIGMLWGFADALVGCALFAWLYNQFTARLSPRHRLRRR